MEDIELVIKLPEKVYRYAKRYNDSSMLALREMDMCMNAIANGTPLEDIKAEFISLYPKNYAGEPELNGCSCVFSLNEVMEIIDKHISGK